MTEHPQLRALIDSINSRDNKQLSFQYADKHLAVITLSGSAVILQTTNLQLAKTMYAVLGELLQGKIPGRD